MPFSALSRWGAAVVLLFVPASAPASASAWRPPPRADLVVHSVSDPPAAARPGARLNVGDVVFNQGHRDAGSSWTAYALAGWHAWLPLGGRAVPALARGAESGGAADVTIPLTARDGRYALVVCADARRQVPETHERNNCRVARRRLTVDSVAPPAPGFVERPDAQTNRTSARPAFTDAEHGVTFACRLDEGAEAPCMSPLELTGLAEGVHRFTVWALDAAGNRGPAAAVEWTVDLTAPPPAVLDEHPSALTTANTAHFVFHGDEPDPRFECALDDAQPSACTSPLDYAEVPDGKRAFVLTARDGAGNASEPVLFEWTVLPDQRRLGDGAWSWFADPRAVRYTGARTQTYVGWVAQNGDIKVAAYDHATLVRTTAVLAPQFELDDHANPAIQILPTGHVRVYWSAHGGVSLFYRTSLQPEDVTAWGPVERVATNTVGTHGYTYPNPVHLSAEDATYLFWRGGNFNPTFSVQRDGEAGWSPAHTAIFLADQRPYVKVATNGSDRIALAYTDGHPAREEFGSDDVNIHYAEYRSGPHAGLYHADGTRIGALDAAIAPTDGDMVSDPPYPAWVHDVAFDAQGHPVIVFVAFATDDDHRYMYARWTGERWDVHEIVAGGGSIHEGGTQPLYSGGLTLNHQSPDIVYLSRPVNGVFEIETWQTHDGGATWTSTPVTAGSTEKNVRPVSPRGLPAPFTGDLSVIWMQGSYPSFIRFKTSMQTILATGGNQPPIASATATPPGGAGPLTVTLDGSASQDREGPLGTYRWDFGDGTQGEGVQVRHTYRAPGTYFARLTVVDGGGAADAFIVEMPVGAWPPPDVVAGPAWGDDEGNATLSGVVTGHEQSTSYHFEYGLDDFTARTAETPVRTDDHDEHAVRVSVDALDVGAVYKYRLVATNETGTTASAPRTFTAAASPSPYRTLVASTPGLVAYWRLGEATGPAARDETGASPGTYAAMGVTLGRPGAIAGDPDTAAGFDGSKGEMSATITPLGDQATLEGWFDWRGGTSLLRDDTTSGGWILAYANAGKLATRIAGTVFNTDRTAASVQNGWHHFALVRRGQWVRFYLDGQPLTLTPTSTPLIGSTASTALWHVMRNGAYGTQFTRGSADEVAIYSVGLTVAEIQRRVEAGRGS